MKVVAGKECAARPVGSRRGGELMEEMCGSIGTIRDGIAAAIIQCR